MSERRPVADILTLPVPCDVAWDDMHGDGNARFCARCRHDVHDLSALTLSEVNDLLASRGSDVCVNFLVDVAGNMVTRPDEKRRLPTISRVPRGLSTLVALATAAAGAGMVAGCSKQVESGAPVESTVAAESAPSASAPEAPLAAPTTTTPPPPAPIDVRAAVPPASATAPSAEAIACKQPPPHRLGGKPSAPPQRRGGKPSF